MKTIRRTPIVLNKNTVALIYLFERYDNLDDLWMFDLPNFADENYQGHEDAAKQFIAQLDGHWCVLFMEHLIKKAFQAMVEEDRATFTKDAAENLIKELIEINNKKNDK